MVRFKVSVSKCGLLLRQMRIILLCRIEDFKNLAVRFRPKDLKILTGSPSNFRFLGEIVLPQPLLQSFRPVVQDGQTSANDL